MDKATDSKRRSRNLSEKKRRDQFNNLINELHSLIEPSSVGQNTSYEDEDGLGLNSVTFARRSPALVDSDAFKYKRQMAGPASISPDPFNFSQMSSRQQRRAFGPKHPMKSKAASCSTASQSGSISRQRRADKSSVLKYAMEFLKMHANPGQTKNSARKGADNPTGKKRTAEKYHCDAITAAWKPPYISDDEFSLQMLEAMDAFIVVCEVNPEAKIIYSSDTLTNLLNYTGTCSSLTPYDYVSLFDLISPADRQQVERLFREAPSGLLLDESPPNHANDTLTHQDGELPAHSMGKPATAHRVSTSSCPDFQSLASSDKDEFESLSVNFHIGLNLTEIKQRRIHQRNKVLLPYATNQVEVTVSDPMQSASQHGQSLQQANEYMRIGSEHESAIGRSQQSIAEQQQHLLSEGREEQQERNQQQQQEQQLEQRRQDDCRDDEMTHIDPRELQPIDDQQLSDTSSAENGNNSGDDRQRQNSSSSSGINSDENDQPSGTGSDDASDSNRSKNMAVPERRHIYRHHHHHHHHHHTTHRQKGHQVGQRRQKQGSLASSRQQYEFVRLMATFKGLDENGSGAASNNSNCYKFEEPPPARKDAQRRYFICIGRLVTPRLSYDLKIIVPPMRGVSNLFHNIQFLSKHTLKWRFLWVDNRAPNIIGYLPFEVLGTSGYDYYHWDDLDKLVISHECLIRDGHARSGPYRFLTKGQQWLWLKTNYSVVMKPQFYVEQKRKQLRREQQLKLRGQKERLDYEQRRSDSSLKSIGVGGGQHWAGSAPTNGPTMALPDGRVQPRAEQLCAYSSYMLEHEITQTAHNQSFRNDGMSYTNSHSDTRMGQAVPNVSGMSDGSIPSQMMSSNSDRPVNRAQAKKFCSGNHKSCINSAVGNKSYAAPMGQRRQKSAGKVRSSPSDGCATLGGGQTGKRNGEQMIKEESGKCNNLGQPLEVGNGLNSRSLDHFKFILCTHTVIGFDESDGYLNSKSTALSAPPTVPMQPQNRQPVMYPPRYQKPHLLHSDISMASAARVKNLTASRCN